MSDRFKNWTFVFLSFLCLSSTVLNTHVCSGVLTNLHHEQNSLRNVLSSQVYAGHVAVVAKYEAERANAIQKQYAKLATEYLNLMTTVEELQVTVDLQNMSRQLARGYMLQLLEYIDNNNLPVPAFDASKVHQPRSGPPSGVDAYGNPVNPLETAPIIP